MTIKLTDVAKKAGVSATTVSRVINNYGSLSQKTIDKVHAAMKELNYQPNSLARSLQGKNTQLVGIIFPSVSHPFFGELVEKIETNLFQQGYKAILCNSAHNKEKERNYLNMLAANKVDGIIAGAHNLGIQEYEDIQLPIISFDRELAATIPIVGGNNYQGGALAAETLFLRGCRNIGIITGSNASNSPTNDRLNGFCDFLKAQQIEPHVFRFESFEHTTALKNIKIKQILAKKMDGLFCTDDFTALLVQNNCQLEGISIPTDLKLVGYDGTAFIQNHFPQLTTIVQPIDELAKLLVDLLIQRITHPEKELAHTYQLPVRLAQGQTT
ncbi:LacI family DNA-binding transcriptional regulator [Enterococcus saccharolyticus]|uniref:LacI family DNA-binding transcriptional regulator n=1 Tax=Enterococcus TaxID=1350 RepID=UPI001E3ABA84|nr:LacI family DNA-binding transcriptional regulator [Enterococcus saccharolyticus]MCD5002967.1 LacI family DNA-binding transcriptional regulator [Enterococcus saccharolyticus]